MLGGKGEDKIVGANGNDLIDGEQDADHLFGGIGSDVLKGGNGDDRLVGGIGDDTLFGGQGTDVFVFKRGTKTGADKICDFENGLDKIEIQGDKSFSDLRIVRDGSDRIITWDGNEITLVDIAGKIGPADFDFV